ncbi:MAG: hypothetical protein QM726_15070 [Chitinophagaceae bacterium]
MKLNQPSAPCHYCAENMPGLMLHILQDGAHYLLCNDCGNQLKDMIAKSTKPTVDLYFSLIKKGIPAHLEKFSGQPITNIHITKASLKIAITNNILLQDSHKALTELINTFHSFKKEMLTIKVPHILVTDHLQQVTSYITAMIKLRQLGWMAPGNNQYFA